MYGNLPFYKIQVNCFMAPDDSSGAKIIPKYILCMYFGLVPSFKTFLSFINRLHYRGLECKSRSQETPGVTGKFGLGIRNEAGQRLIEFCQENAHKYLLLLPCTPSLFVFVITNTLFQQHKRRLYTWTSPDGQHQNQIDYILCSQR